jgi:hypothetical protein
MALIKEKLVRPVKSLSASNLAFRYSYLTPTPSAGNRA